MAFNYKDPRWQKRRLEIMERDDFQCVACNSKTNELHVHHKRYKGQPWQAKDDDMQTLCVKCHTALGPHPKAGIWYDGVGCIHVDHCPACKRNDWMVMDDSVCCVADKCYGFKFDDIVKRASVVRVRFLTFEWWPTKQAAQTQKTVKKKQVKQTAYEPIYSTCADGRPIEGKVQIVFMWRNAAELVGGLAYDFAMMAEQVTAKTLPDNDCISFVVRFPEAARAATRFMKRNEIHKQFCNALLETCHKQQLPHISKINLEIFLTVKEEHNA